MPTGRGHYRLHRGDARIITSTRRIRPVVHLLVDDESIQPKSLEAVYRIGGKH